MPKGKTKLTGRGPGFIDRTGHRYGRLVVLHEAESLVKSRWVCQCDCGNQTTVRGGNLHSGDIKSCGCLRKEVMSATGTTNMTHGHSMAGKLSSTYVSWMGTIKRTTNPNADNYPLYGGANPPVIVCDRWLKFENFLQDMGERLKGTTLGRILDLGDYEPGNAFWMTTKEQGLARRNKHALLKWAAQQQPVAIAA